MTNIIYIDLQVLLDLAKESNAHFLQQHKFVVFGYLARLYTIDEINQKISETTNITDCCVGRTPVFKTVDNYLFALTADDKINKQLSVVQGASVPLGFVIQWHVAFVLEKLYKDAKYQYAIVYTNESEYDDLLSYQTKRAIHYDNFTDNTKTSN